MLATIENMRAHHAPGVLAYSPTTGEEYSSDPGDYWWAPEGYTLTDAEENPLHLVTRRTAYTEVSA